MDRRDTMHGCGEGCTHQTVIRSTLSSIIAVVEDVGSRPPGLLVVGEACGVLRGLMEKAECGLLRRNL